MSFHGLPINPIFLHVLSLSLHLVLLVPFSISWARNGSKHKFQSTLFYPKPLFCALAMPLVSHFYWCYKNGWSNPNQEFLNLLNFVLKTVIWGLFNLGQRRRFLFLFRAWYAFYFLIFFCHSFAINIGLYGKNAFFFPIQCLIISDFVGLLFFCYLVRKEGKDSNFHDQEPLLSDIGITPYSKAGIFSILTFSWVGPLIASGNKKALELEDIPQLTSEDSVFDAFSSFRNKLEAQCGVITTLKLVKSLILLAWKEVLLTGFFALLNTLASYVGPYLIQTFVQYLNGEGRFKSDGYLLVSAFFVAKLIESLSQRQCLFRLKQVGIRIEALLMTLIYSKTMTLSFESKQSYASGEIINLMSVDAKRIGDFSRCVHDMWTVVLQVALSLFILYRSLGMASLAAFAATVILMLANVPVGWLQGKFQGKLMESKDKRMKATSEVLRNMRILKLQGWEMKFLSKIMKLRMTEQVWLKKYVYTIAISVFALYVTPTFVSMVTFGTCMLIGIPLDPGKILSALATFRILQGSIHNLPESISMIAHTKVSLDRIASFLRLDDLQCDVVEKLPRESSNTAIRIIDGNFSWDLSSPNATLKNINLTIFHGMRVAICGTVGSGKSSLLSCILGEVPKVSGTLRVCGRKAFVGQSPWIQSDKIQENILFGDEMDRERYENVLEACSLKKDLEILPFGDQTIVGERGINLSGGQKQRIQLARALYQDADIYMLDDPFSAVDAHTGSHLFKECILSLLSSKTVIYITHQVEFLPAADLILVMKDGKITQFGKYNDLLNSGTDFMELVGAHRKALVSLDSLDGGAVSDKLSTSAQEAKKDMKNDNKTSDIVETKGQLIQKEEREKGKVGFSVYWKYITTAYGGAFVPLILFIHIVYEILQIGSNYWMAWATSFSSNEKSPVTVVYIALGIATTFCIFIRVMLLAAVGYKTAAILFQKLHLCIFRAPMSFFDATPSGRIINRASTDQSSLDADIPYQVGSFAFLVIQLLGNIAVMSQAAWQVFIIFIPVISISVWYQQYYLPSARELARLVGVCKAPVIQHFAETISGTTTIRSFDQESRFEKENMKVIDQYSRPKFNIAAAMEWLCFRLDMLSSITFAFCLMFLISIPKGVIDPGIAGLAVTYGLTLKKLQSSLILRLCSMENKIISVERILQYTCIPSEPPLVIEENQPNPSWPSNGEVNICDLQVRYAPHLPVVLRGITCKFHGGLKTGIVGRTGSGKSTLIQTLFRMIEPCAGKIVIDGINISSIGLHDLRNRLSIIPQDPTMFEGTVRSNLDPLQEYSDEQIWEVLDKCQLADKVRKKEGQLGSTVCENGENWSMGERQLVCLGRVLLKKSKILVLDEATASVDTATDSIIHQILSQNLCDSTLITIAHRISSVLHSHMILLLNQGVVEEYESPSRLLEDKSSSFSQLVGEYSMRSKATSVHK